jgi:glucose-6-phosphate 1-dehydrogenase
MSSWQERYCKRFNEDLKKAEMSEQSQYEVTYKFKDKFEYEYFLEAQTEYSKLRSFCDEFERQLRSWRKYCATPDSLRGLDIPPDVYGLLANEIERWYYDTKKQNE